MSAQRSWGEVPPIAHEQDTTVEAIQKAIPVFTQVNDYTTFRAEFAIIDSDIVVHFFLPHEAYRRPDDLTSVQPQALRWFCADFPQILSPTAEQYFNATLPVLAAKYTAEVQSWWLRCGGFGSRLDPEGFTLKFLERLDQAVDASRGLGGAPSAL